jgi:hypothetical protein
LRHQKAKPGGLKRRAIALFLLCTVATAPVAGAADLQPATIEAFDRYARLTQSQFEAENKDLSEFLWIDRLPAARRDAAYTQLRSGQVMIEKLETTDAGASIPVPGGMIHHWVGTVFVPGATLAQVLSFEQDYDHQQQYFAPAVVRSKILTHSGPDFTINLRFYKKKIVTSVLDTDHRVHYVLADSTHAWSISQTTRIQQVNHVGEPGETLEREGHDDGFLWRMNTYWRFEQKDGGTYIESQSVSLTRDVPTGLGWMIGPYITSVPRESLTFTLAQTRQAIQQRIAN